MTNEEKAREIAKDYAPTLENVTKTIVLKEACMEMAQWKDDKIWVLEKQNEVLEAHLKKSLEANVEFFQKRNNLLNEICNWLINNAHKYVNSYGSATYESYQLVCDLRIAIK